MGDEARSRPTGIIMKIDLFRAKIIFSLQNDEMTL
jgi:hypothetical protein